MATGVSDTILGEVKRTPATICEFEWSIQDFVSLSSEMLYQSSSFSFAGVEWAMFILPNGNAKSNSTGYIDLYLGRKVCNDSISQDVSFSFKTSAGKEDRNRYRAIYNSFDAIETYEAIRCLSRKELLKRKSELLPSDVLTVLCTLKYSKSPICASKDCTLRNFISPRYSKILHDFKELFLRKEDCDVVLKVKGQEFLAHKNILKARSSVFASTFRNNMKEKATGVVEIEDCDPSPFSDFLCFLYCGDSKNVSQENVFSHFIAADKYDVQDLKEMCLEFMKENLTVDTFCDTMTIALRHSERELIELTTDFFVKNAKEITLTVNWQTFLAENPTVGIELIVKLLSKVKLQ